MSKKYYGKLITRWWCLRLFKYAALNDMQGWLFMGLSGPRKELGMLFQGTNTEFTLRNDKKSHI